MKGYQGGLQQMMRQANQMQEKIKKLQEELSQREFESTSGGGAITVKLKGETTLTDIKIREDLAKTEDIEILQDLILVAVNEALKIAKDTTQKEMEKITGGFQIPGLF